MFNPPLPMDKIVELSRDESFRAAMANLYHRLDERVASHAPVCINRGLCCKFDSYGHSLFVTSAELAYFIAETPTAAGPHNGTCPHQRDGICTTRHQRPTGCRIFFCEALDRSWPSDETEFVLDELKSLHVRFQLPYAYVEWLAALHQWHDYAQRAVTPAKAGVQAAFFWIPACAGITVDSE